MLGFLIISKTSEGNSKLTVVGFPLPSDFIFAIDNTLNTPHSWALSFQKILYVMAVLDNLSKASFRVALSLSFKPDKRLIIPIQH